MDPRKSAVLGKVIDFCHDNLLDDRIVSNYIFKTRGISREIASKFKLGAFPTNIFRIINHVGKWDLRTAGILSEVDGQDFSKFIYNRVIIPIFDIHNRPIGIIGRTLLGEDERVALNVAKYDNTRFPKGSCLFGLNVAKDSIRRSNEAVVVEGNFDVITAHQMGFTNVIASSGSWLTRKQVYLLSRYTQNIKTMFDNDEAGKRATETILKKTAPPGTNISAKEFPEQFKDPDEYFKSLKD